MFKLINPITHIPIEVDCVSEDSDKSCDSDERYEYSWICKLAKQNNFIIDDKSQLNLIITHIKFVDSSNISCVRNYYQWIIEQIEINDRESFCCVFEDVFGYSLFEYIDESE